MQSISRGSILMLGLTLAGCGGGDGGGNSKADSGPKEDSGSQEVQCPSEAPDRDEMMGPCCYRASNSEHRDQPTLRLSALRLTAPASLASPILVEPLSKAIDEERFRWLLHVEIEDGGAATLETGYAQRLANGTYTFCKAGVAAPCKPGFWGAAQAAGKLTGENLSSTAPMPTFRVPIYDDDGVTIPLTLPLRDLLVTKATLSEDRSCIGRLDARGRTFDWNTASGSLSAFVTVEEARQGDVIIEGTVNTSLCAFIAGLAGEDVDCQEHPRADWANKPDAICDEQGCEKNTDTTEACNPSTTCNAWQLTAGFAAQGVAFTE
jgi:hypothetical protein